MSTQFAQPTAPVEALSDALVELAHEYGVATEYWDWQDQYTQVPLRTVQAVLLALDVPAASDHQIHQSLDAARLRRWRQTLPPVTVVRQASITPVTVHVPEAAITTVWVECEDGGRRDLAEQPRTENTPWPTRECDGVAVARRSYVIPADLPLGWHQVHVTSTDGIMASATLVVTPYRVELPEPVRQQRTWGWLTQLYSVRSSHSWGLGDLADLDELAAWSASELGAGFVMVNPLHAAEPVTPVSASPYLPTSKRFFNPIYLRVEDIPEVAYVSAAQRSVMQWQADALRETNTNDALLDRDAVWQAKLRVLETVFAQPRSRGRQSDFEAFCRREGVGLVNYATWCALAEVHGVVLSSWPVELLDVESPQVAQARHQHAERVEFHMWLQWCVDEQLASAQRHARQCGMPIGIMHDLAVGTNANGADAWALASVLARSVTVGAPPDAFNQQGQGWGQPPLRPDKLAEVAYAPYRDMLRTVLRHSGGLRVDHIIGLFRLWWIPQGLTPDQGTYVRYDHEAMVGILALEAHRAGAVVVGEDLGTVEPWARDYLRERGLLGTSIVWFEHDETGQPLPPQRWRELCLASVTTHDLPPTAGYLAGEHVKLRNELGLLTRPVEEEAARDAAERAAMLQRLRDEGLLGDEASEHEQMVALHRYVARTPALLMGVSLADAVGERRTMNQPGTNTEYPNWRIPLGNPQGHSALLDQVLEDAAVRQLTDAVRAELAEHEPAPPPATSGGDAADATPAVAAVV